MAEQATIRSVDALEALRTSMIVFTAKAKKSIDEAGDELRRTRRWINDDRLPHWQQQFKKRRQLLDQAQSELMSAKLSEFVDTPSVQQQAVRKAKVLLQEAEDKLRALKAWERNYDGLADPLAKKLDSLRHHLEEVMPRGVAYLTEAIKILDDYTSMAPGEPSLDKPQPTAPTEPSSL